MAKPWKEVVASPAYQALSPAQQAEAKQEYFSQVVAPRVPEGEEEAAWAEFEAYKPAAQAVESKSSVGKSALSGLQGLGLSILGTPVDTVQNVMDLGRAGVGTVMTAAGRPDLAPDIPDRKGIVGSTAWLSDQAAKRGALIGPANPNSAADRASYAVGGGAGSALLAPQRLPVMAANATRYGLAGLVGQQVGEATESPELAIAANMVAGRAPEIVQDTARLVARGRDANVPAMQQRIDDFERLNTAPTMGLATDRAWLKGMETMMGRAPGGAGVMAESGKGMNAGMGKAVDRMVDNTAPKSGVRKAGIAIEDGITGVGGFVDKFRDKSGKLYDEVDQFIPADTPASLPNTQKALLKMTAPIKGALATSKLLENPKLVGIKEALDEDLLVASGKSTKPAAQQNAATPGQLPYEAIKELRTKVGDMLRDSGRGPTDVPTGELKQLYSSLTTDMEAAVRATKNPKAMEAYQRANAFYRAGRQRIDTLERVVEKAGGPEAIFTAATSGTKEGASTLHAVMKSLPLEGKRIVAATILERMGRANPGQQDAEGSLFSAQTFLTKYNQMSDDAKRAAFAPLSPTAKADLDALSRVAAGVRDRAANLPNPSGTAAATAQMGAYGTLGLATLTGNVGTAGLVIMGLLGTNAGARLLTNPTAVRWMAKITKMPPKAADAELVNFATWAQRQSDPEISALGESLLAKDQEGEEDETSDADQQPGN